MQPLRPEYFATTYAARTDEGELELRIGVPSPRLDRLLARYQVRTWAFITAWNPGGRAAQDVQNESRNRELRAPLQDFRPKVIVFDGEGRSDTSSHAEESFLVLGIRPDEGISLAQRFDQDAILVGQAGGCPELADCRLE